MEFLDLLEKRRSVRDYNSKKVLQEEIKDVISVVRNAPSWKNSQTARYHCVISEEMVEKFRQECLPEFNINSTKGASAYIVSTFVKGMSGFNIHTKEAENELGNGWGCYDLGLSNAMFIMAAKDKGMDTLIMGIRDGAKIRELLHIPEEEVVGPVIAVGYSDHEAEKKPRKEVDEIFTVY